MEMILVKQAVKIARGDIMEKIQHKKSEWTTGNREPGDGIVYKWYWSIVDCRLSAPGHWSSFSIVEPIPVTVNIYSRHRNWPLSFANTFARP